MSCTRNRSVFAQNQFHAWVQPGSKFRQTTYLMQNVLDQMQRVIEALIEIKLPASHGKQTPFPFPYGVTPTPGMSLTSV